METSDSKESLSKGAVDFLTGTFMSRLTGMIRDLLMAYCFGVSAAVGSFLIAFRLSNLLRRLFGEGALLNGFIPFFEAKRRKQERGGAIFFRDLFWSLFCILLSIVLILETFLILIYQFSGLSLEVKQILFMLMIQLPGVIFICLFGLSMALLQCEKNFFIPGVAPVAFNIIWIIAILVLRNYPQNVAMNGLSIAVVAAFFLQWAATVAPIKKYCLSLISKKECFCPNLFQNDLRLMVSPVIFGIIGVAASQINSAMDILMVRFISPSGPALLSYANRVQQLPIALFAIAIASSLLPALSRAIKKDFFDDYINLLQHGLLRTFALLFPGMIGIFVLGLCSINLLYGRGQFTNDAILNTTTCLWSYGLGLIPSAFILLLAPAYYARRDYRTPMIGAILSMVINVSLNSVMIFALGFPVFTVAISTSITSFVNLFFLSKRLLVNIFPKMLPSFKRITLSALSSGILTAICAFFLFKDPSIYLLMGGENFDLARDFASQIIQFSTLTFIYGALFFLFAYLYKAKDALALLGGIL